MHLPIGAIVDQIDILQFTDLPPILLAGKLQRSGQAVDGKDALCPLHIGRHLVAQGDNLHAVEVREAFDGAASAHAQSDEGDADNRYRVASELQHIVLPFGTGRFGEHDFVVHDTIGFVGCGAGASGDERQRKKRPDDKTEFHKRMIFIGHAISDKVRKNLSVHERFRTFRVTKP